MEAFEQLVCRYEGRVFGFLFQCCRNTEDAREITQDAFVKAYRAIGQFDPRQDFAAWLFTIARRKWIDRFRSTPSAGEPSVAELADPADPAELLAKEEDRRAIWALASQLLPPPQFQALWLRYVEDMSVAAVARVLARTSTHVKVLLFRARKTLAARLKPAAQSAFSTRAPALPAAHSAFERTSL